MLELIQGLTGFGAVAGCKGAADEVVTYQSSVAIFKDRTGRAIRNMAYEAQGYVIDNG